ncbi:MAG: bifunctional 5,10-methylenetetrahydrofolate dehydrogenase/5,10-methenyltetrahydrofolate cyclohydrolase [Betaproteobacteria bacterium]
MPALILDGVAIARHVYASLKPRIAALVQCGVQPGLAALQIGDNAASRLYVRNKVRACTEIGIYSEIHQLDADCTETAALTMLERLNRNPRLHGVIVQLPLPPGFDVRRLLQSVAIEKDVDGFNWSNLGALVDTHGGLKGLTPCTPLGVMTMLDHAGITIEGRHAVVIGRSPSVGKSMALLLINRGATVTVCHSKTPDLTAHASRADILIAAVGRAGLVTADMIKPGAVVIDIGINRLPDGRLAGDVTFAAACERASWITPVPGGVGPMTVAMLITNTVTAAERTAGLRAPSAVV